MEQDSGKQKFDECVQEVCGEESKESTSAVNNHGKHDRWRNRKREGKYNTKQTKQKEVQNVDVSECSPIIKAFYEFKAELDAKHDKTERLIKMSRDITIESKRIIFLLHSNTGDRSKILKEANDRLIKLLKTIFLNVARELEDEDMYKFTRAYSPGIQEFIEAYTYYEYLSSGNLLSRGFIQNLLTYDYKEVDNDSSSANEQEVTENTESKAVNESSADLIITDQKLKVLLKLSDYVMGIEDLTGELMRHCINVVTAGDIEGVFKARNFVNAIYIGLLSLIRLPQGRAFYKKRVVVRNSLVKMERTCYMIRIRGSEIPSNMLAAAVRSQDDNQIDEDEGFYKY